jgi:transcriptional regulator with XRE-family HTH domain
VATDSASVKIMETAQNRGLAKPSAPRKRRRGEQDIYAGERLRVARQLARVSQQQLGEALGVSFQAVQKYESGENRLSAGRMVKAAAFLGVDLAFFAKDRTPSGEAGAIDFTAEEIELIRAWRAVRSEALRSQFRRMLRAVAGMAEEGEASAG